MAKKKKKNKKNGFKKFLFGIFVIVGIAVVGFLGFKAYNELNEIAEIVSNYEYQIPEEITDKIDLPTKISENITIEWSSSNEQVVSSLGLITKPNFDSETQKVTLTGKVKIEFKEILSETLLELLGYEIEDIVIVLEVDPEEATDELKVKSVVDRLTLIDETYYSISLPSKLLYESIEITWDSLNDNVMTDNGVITTPSTDTTITVKAVISSNDYQEVVEFKINILSTEPVLEIIDDSFDNQAATTQYSTIKSTGGVTYYNARIMEEEGSSSSDNDVNATIPSYLRLRNKDENNGSFEIVNIINPKQFSFNYKFSGSQKTESSKLVITYIVNNQEIKEEITVLHKDTYLEYTKDLTAYEKVSIKVEHIDEWSSDTYIDIDDVNVYTNVSLEDIQTWVINNTPTSVSKSIILPFTTEFGGIITWSSNSDAINQYGIVTRSENPQTATLTASINYLGQTSQITIEIVIKGEGSVLELEIFFIDIGKYGAGDCGECTYIKYGDIDIIIDAGDHFDSTVQAITEAINQRLEDDKIEYVIATHPDGDHIGGMAKLFENFQIENLIKFEGGYTTKKYENLKKAYELEGCNVYQIKSDIMDKNLGDKFIKLSNEVFISFIDTTYYTSEESNGKSIVFTLEAYGTRVLMTGDADNATGHTDLEDKYKNQVGDIDILKVVHHGTANGTTMEYLQIVDPEVAIICNGNYLGNKHGHPHPTALKNLYNYDSNIKVYAITGGGTIDGVANKTNNTYKCSSEDRFNQRNGLISLVIDNNGYKLSSEYYGDNILEINQTSYYQAIVANGLG